MEAARQRATLAGASLVVVVALGLLLPPASTAEQASDPGSLAAGQIDAGFVHACALLPEGQVRCWGFNGAGQLGYGNRATVGDRATPATAGPVNLGAGRRAVALTAGDYHTCAILDDRTVRCWGFGGNGRLGYASQVNVGDDEDPGSAGPVNLGDGRTAKAITAGGSHTCAILDDDTVRCWGFAFYGELGYGNPDPNPDTPTVEPPPLNVGDDEPPAAFGPVNLGAGRKAKAIAAGDLHTCAVRDDDSVLCWGNGANGQLGYGSQANVGDRDTPALVGPVALGAGRSARAIAAGAAQTCALLDNATVRCWGFGGNGRLGYGNIVTIGDTETPGSVGPVDLGAGRSATAIAIGNGHACAVLDNAALRCWGFAIDGRLGYGNRVDVGDDETPGSAGPVDLGPGRGARAIAPGGRHTCARLDDGARPEEGGVRCWGFGPNGRLGHCSDANVGDDEPPSAVPRVDLGIPGSGAAGCLVVVGVLPAAVVPPPPAEPVVGTSALQAETVRKAAFDGCGRAAARHYRREVRRARRLSDDRRGRALRHAKRHRSSLAAACVKRHGRTPGQVTGLRAASASSNGIRLDFAAPGSDGAGAPAARTYVIKQSRRPIRSARAFRRAQSLCKGRCAFETVTEVGAKLTLTVTDLRRATTYHYAVAARDNVSGRLGRRSRSVRVKTR